MKKFIVSAFLSVSILFASVAITNATIVDKVLRAEIKEALYNIKGGIAFSNAYEAYAVYYNNWYPAKDATESIMKLREVNATQIELLTEWKTKATTVKMNCQVNKANEVSLGKALDTLNTARDYLKKNSKITKVLNIASADMKELMTKETKPTYFKNLSCETVSKKADAAIVMINKNLLKIKK